MRARFRPLVLVLMTLFLPWSAGLNGPAFAADWPMYRGNAARTAGSAESLAAPLHAQWRYAPAHGPQPAWPDPVREVNLMAFDHAFHTVVAGGKVFFGSSADRRVRALDLATGEVRWTFCTDAPVRFAPSVADGRVFAASDDGCVYCLAAADGKLIWRVRGGPRDERILGNGQMISRWPVRTGVLVDGGVVYFLVGMWPGEGVWACAVAAADGKVVWKTRPAGALAPQGYLSADDKTLYVPAGRADAWAVDRASGKARALKGIRTQAVLAGELTFTGPFTHGANENLPIAGGLPFAPRRRMLAVLDRKTGKGRGRLNGMEHLAAGEKQVFAAGSGRLAAYLLPSLKRKWEVPFADVRSLAVAAGTLVVGAGERVALVAAADGKTLWDAPVPSSAMGLAVADGRVLASCRDGRILCFAQARPAAHRTPAPAPPAAAPSAGAVRALAESILKQTGVREGFCLLAGKGRGGLALELARQAGTLRVYVATHDAAESARLRRVLDRDGADAARVIVHPLATKLLPYPDYFADLVVTDISGAVAASELGRVLRPCGGVAFVIGGAKAAGKAVALPAGEKPTFAAVPGGGRKVVRGDLPGAGWWTHQYGGPGKSGSSGDTRVRWPLKLLWFGEPGPQRMMNRHLRGTAPVCLAGRMFILGQHGLIAVDAYNGRELWSRDLPFVARRVVDIRGGSLVADGDSVFLATADLCLRLASASGETIQRYRLPVARPRIVLASSRTIELGTLGRVVLNRSADALEITLTTSDTKVANADPAARPTSGDSWELFFDFRPPDRRTEQYGAGAFQAIVVPARPEAPKASWVPGVWSKPPALDVAGRADAKGTCTTVRIPWARVAKLVGARPTEFAFGAILNSSDDGKTRTARTFRFANDASYRLANCRGQVVLGSAPGEAAPSNVLPAEAPESLTWGNLLVAGDVVVGTTATAVNTPRVLALGRDVSSEGHDYTGPVVPQVLGNVGIDPAGKHVFALDRRDGRMRWHYTTGGVIPANGVAVWRGQVFVLDRRKLPPPAQRGRRRGQPAPAPEDPGPAFIQVLDLASGTCLRRIEGDLAWTVGLRIGNGVLLATHLAGMSAFDAATGKKLWTLGTHQAMHHCSAYLRVPVIAGRWVYDEPRAYDLRTGAPRLDKAGKPWQWGGFRGCGTVSAGQEVLFYRTGTPAVEDIAGLTGRHELPGIRPGCYINMIPAAGLALMPEASSGCGCPYNFQTTVALQPAAE